MYRFDGHRFFQTTIDQISDDSSDNETKHWRYLTPSKYRVPRTTNVDRSHLPIRFTTPKQPQLRLAFSTPSLNVHADETFNSDDETSCTAGEYFVSQEIQQLPADDGKSTQRSISLDAPYQPPLKRSKRRGQEKLSLWRRLLEWYRCKKHERHLLC
jgi:hypothetical protein